MRNFTKLLYIVPLLCLSMTIMTGCGDDKEPVTGEVTLKVNPEAPEEFGYRGGSQVITVSITPSGHKWSAVPDQDWLNIIPSGNTFTIEVPEYSGDKDRDNNITVSAQGHEDIVIAVRQKCFAGTEGNTQLSVDAEEIDLPCAGPGRTVNITCNYLWNCTITYNEGNGWLEVDKTEGEGNAAVTLTAAANTAVDQRTATLSVTSGNRVTNIPVTQRGDVLEIGDILGDWDAPDIILYWGSSYERLYKRNTHTVTFTRAGKNTVVISNIAYINTDEGLNYGDELTAEFDPQSRTLSIPSPQKMSPKWFDYIYDEAYYMPCYDLTYYKDNWTQNEQFPPITFSRNEQGGLQLDIATGMDITVEDGFVIDQENFEYIDEPENYKAILLVGVIRSGNWNTQYIILAGDKWTKAE